MLKVYYMKLKELITRHILYISNAFIFYKLTFQKFTTPYSKIFSLKYLRSTTSCAKMIKIRKFKILSSSQLFYFNSEFQDNLQRDLQSCRI